MTEKQEEKAGREDNRGEERRNEMKINKYEEGEEATKV